MLWFVFGSDPALIVHTLTVSSLTCLVLSASQVSLRDFSAAAQASFWRFSSPAHPSFSCSMPPACFASAAWKHSSACSQSVYCQLLLIQRLLKLQLPGPPLLQLLNLARMLCLCSLNTQLCKAWYNLHPTAKPVNTTSDISSMNQIDIVYQGLVECCC